MSNTVITNPIIVTTPRTGSTVICRMLWNLSKEFYGHKNILYEYFTVTDLYESRYKKIDGCIQSIIPRKRIKHEWCTNYRLEKLKRLLLLIKDYKYTMKIFPMQLEPEIVPVIVKNFDLIYLERRDKIRQLLSFSSMMITNVSHYTSSDSEVKTIEYSPELTDKFFELIEAYHTFKKNNQGITIYYEDFIENGANEAALIKLLNLPIEYFKLSKVETIPTPYLSENLEDLIVNKGDWLRDRPKIIDRLSIYN